MLKLSNEELVEEIKQEINVNDNMTQLYLNNEPFIKKLANKYSAYCDFDDLVQQGALGLFNAIEDFDETLGYKFLTYASHYIKQSMTRYIGNNQSTIRIPIHLISQIQKHKKIIRYYISEHGREPTDYELCTALNINFKQLEELKANITKYKRIESLDKPINNTEGDSITIGDSVFDNEVDVEADAIDNVYSEHLASELWEIVARECEEQQAKVICARFKENKTFKEAGEKIGVTTERARIVEQNGLRKLRYPRVVRELNQKFEINNSSAMSGGVKSFRYTGTSSTERVALKNIELENELLQKLVNGD